nr:cobyrinate a,c-diamide synthase [Corynebacterium lactis]
MVAAPGLVIAATASGTGKTTIATGLMRALSRSRTVAPFKVGPDYIDPGYHGVAAGRPGRNLDSYMCGPQSILPLYSHGSEGCDIGVVEGVMGLFDGRIGPDPLSIEGSTAEIASLLGLPVVLVIDARHMSQSAAAMVHGFATMRTDVRVSGVIINRVGSPRHADIITRAVEAMGVEVLGAIPRVTDIEVPSRHLGLITAVEQGEQLDAVIEAMANLVERYVDIDRLLALAATPAEATPWDPREALEALGVAHSPAEVRVAVASGPAFSFTYAEHLELLSAAGAEVVEFDPLADDLPDAAGYIIPGGFPEEHADALSVRDDVRRGLQRAADDGAVIHGECAGLLWLLEDLGGRRMCGIIPGRASMARLKLGYREAVALSDSALATVGTRVRGHEFHKTALSADTAAVAEAAGFSPAWAWRGWDGAAVQEGFVSRSGRIHASYLHVHPAGAPGLVGRFVDACAR